MYTKKNQIKVNRQLIEFNPDQSRVVTKSFIPTEERIDAIRNRVLSMSENEIANILKQTIKSFEKRHDDIKRIFKNNYDSAIGDPKLPLNTKLLLGSYFTMEYSIEAAALFNPSIVEHPEQDNLKEGELRVILSFRAVGEGHISSIVFREGIINSIGEITLKPKSPIVERGQSTINPIFVKQNFIFNLKRIKDFFVVQEILDGLLEEFTLTELLESIGNYRQNSRFKEEHNTAIETMLWLADSTYTVEFDKEKSVSSRVIFPVSKNESKGLEDARFVKFIDEEGEETYYATYSAYNGLNALPQMIKTSDFLNFKVSTLIGDGSQNKGMALFPEKINDKYCMISRQDNENLYIMFSDNLHHWGEYSLIKEPTYYWEFFQIGNCGSPIKTDKGWLLLTHGVGTVRTYCIGAILLDLEDPTKVIGCSKDPILFPNEHERNGYVPNVVYSCGGLMHNNLLIMPYAMSDTRSGIATIDMEELIDNILSTKCKKN